MLVSPSVLPRADIEDAIREATLTFAPWMPIIATTVGRFFPSVTHPYNRNANICVSFVHPLALSPIFPIKSSLTEPQTTELQHLYVPFAHHHRDFDCRHSHGDRLRLAPWDQWPGGRMPRSLCGGGPFLTLRGMFRSSGFGTGEYRSISGGRFDFRPGDCTFGRAFLRRLA